MWFWNVQVILIKLCDDFNIWIAILLIWINILRIHAANENRTHYVRVFPGHCERSRSNVQVSSVVFGPISRGDANFLKFYFK